MAQKSESYPQIAVLLSGFLICFLVDGVCLSFSQFYLDLLEEFEDEEGEITNVGNVITATYLSVGLVSVFLCRMMSLHAVILLGTFIASSGLFLSSLATTPSFFTLSYAGITGFGLGLMYLPSFTLVHMYFDKRRPLAVGLTLSGSAFVIFAIPPFCQLLLSKYDWRNCNRIIAPILLHALVCCVAYWFRSTTSKPSRPARKDDVCSYDDDVCVIMQKIVRQKHQLDNNSDGSLDGWYITGSNNLRPGSPVNHSRPKDEDDFVMWSPMRNFSTRSEGDSAKRGFKSRERSSTRNAAHKVRLGRSDGQNSEFELAQLSTTSLAPTDDNRGKININICVNDHARDNNKNNRNNSDNDDDNNDNNKWGRDSNDDGVTGGRIHCDCRSNCRAVFGRAARDRCKFWAFLKISEVSASVRSLLVELACLVRRLSFIVFLISACCSYLGFYIPYFLLAEQGIVAELEFEETSSLLQIFSGSYLAGQLLPGLLLLHPCPSAPLINCITLIVSGVVTCVVPMMTSYGSLSAYAVCCGTSLGTFMVLRSIILTELYSTDNLASSLGILSFMFGVLSYLAPIITDYLNGLLGSLVFCVGGFLISVGGMVGMLLTRVARWEEAKRIKTKLTNHVPNIVRYI